MEFGLAEALGLAGGFTGCVAGSLVLKRLERNGQPRLLASSAGAGTGIVVGLASGYVLGLMVEPESALTSGIVGAVLGATLSLWRPGGA